MAGDVVCTVQPRERVWYGDQRVVKSVFTFAQQPQRFQIFHDVTAFVGDEQKVQLVKRVVHIPTHKAGASAERTLHAVTR